MQVRHLCDVITCHVDGAESYLLVRISLMAGVARKSIFWQARHVASKTAEAAWRALVNAFTQLPNKNLHSWYAITEEEFLRKVGSFIADGASELGVRRKGQTAEAAQAGDNVFHKLQERKKELCGEGSPSILGFWCTNHRIDIVAGAPEKQIQYVSALLTFFRSLVGHVMASTRSQGILQYIAKLIFLENGVDEGVTSASLASVHRAPTRWLSDVVPLQQIVTRVLDLVLYLFNLTKERDASLRTYGDKMYAVVKDLRFFLVLPGVLDVLSIVNQFNQQSQPESSSLQRVSQCLSLAESRIEDLVLRTESDKNHEHPATLVQAGFLFFVLLPFFSFVQ